MRAVPLLSALMFALATACDDDIAPPTLAAAVAIGIATEPAGAVSGSAFQTQPVVRLLDANGAVVKSSVTVTAGLLVGVGTGTLTGTKSVSTIEGVATFTDLGITGTGAHVLTFTTPGLPVKSATSLTVAAAPVLSGIPAPLPGDRILQDLRAPLQAANNITEAFATLTDHTPFRGALNTAGWGFSTNFDGQGTRAIRSDYATVAGDQQNRFYFRFAAPKPTEIYAQWKGRMGKHPADPDGNGCNNCFALYPQLNGLKRALFGRDVPGQGSQGRIDYVTSRTVPMVPQFEIADKNWLINGPLTGFSFQSVVGTAAFTTTVYIKVATSATANDGIMRLWIDGTLVHSRTDLPAGTEAIDSWALLSTVVGCPQPQAEYIWDILVWAK